MRKKHFLYAAFVFAVIFIFIVYNKRDLGFRDFQAVYLFTKLDPKIAAQVVFKKESGLEAPVFQIPFDEILDVHYASLNQKKEELLILSALQQHVKPTQKFASFALKKPPRPLQEICSQYQFPCFDEKKIKFDPKQEVFLKTDQGTFTMEQINTSHLSLRAAHTEILNHLLGRIDEKIRSRVLYTLAKQQNLAVQDYIEKNIVKNQDLLKYVDQDLEYRQVAPAERPAMMSGRVEQKKLMMVDEYLLKNFIQKPIVVNIQQPKYEFENRWEWTPFFGKQPLKNSLHVILFADHFSEASRQLIQTLLKYRNQKTEVTFAFRPLFFEQDAMQRMLTEMSFCVWSENKEIYWDFLQKTLQLKNDFTEQQLYALVEDSGLAVADIKTCFLQRKMKDAVDYHLQTAKFLKIITPPVLFIGNEVHIGPLTEDTFNRILKRQ